VAHDAGADLDQFELLYRVLKPDGMAVVTSWGAKLLALFDRLDATGKTEYDWERNIDLSFPDRAKVVSRSWWKFEGGVISG
jgi:hypothetical protein